MRRRIPCRTFSGCRKKRNRRISCRNIRSCWSTCPCWFRRTRAVCVRRKRNEKPLSRRKVRWMSERVQLLDRMPCWTSLRQNRNILPRWKGRRRKWSGCKRRMTRRKKHCIWYSRSGNCWNRQSRRFCVRKRRLQSWKSSWKSRKRLPRLRRQM